jgi:hypothetical protein
MNADGISMSNIRKEHSDRYIVQALKYGPPFKWEDTNFQDSWDFESAKVMREHYVAEYPSTTFRIIRRVSNVSEEIIEGPEGEEQT